jgi:mannitol/fructose-specific phosphotransferase system IIA component (Ntr-type)
MKTFRGWVVIQSKTGSDWGNERNWPIVSPVFASKNDAKEWLKKALPKLSCCPVGLRKHYC